MGVNEELMLRIRRAQDQVSRSKGKPASLEETIEAAIAFYLQHKDPLEKARRVIAKKGSPRENARRHEPRSSQASSLNKLFTGTVPGRMPIPAAIAHQIRARDESRCQAKKPGGGTCGERRWTDLHHILPVSQGGANDLQNLITLCRAHHQEVHKL